MANEKVQNDTRYWNAWINDRDPDAGDTLIKKYLPLVSYHVQRIRVGLPKSVSVDELQSLGMMGLFDALNKFEPARDLKFDTYASFRIRGAIIDGLRKEDWLPRSSREKTKRMDAQIEELEQKLLRHATPEEIATHCDLSVEEVYRTVNESFHANVLSVDDQQNENEESENKTYAIKDTTNLTPEQSLTKSELIQDLISQMKHLNEKEQLVLSLFYQDEMTFTEIGEILSLSTSRISQIHSKALFKLRKSLQSEVFDTQF